MSRSPCALVTGGTTGIGLEACKQLAATGVNVILTSRTEAKGKLAVKEILLSAAAAAANSKKAGGGVSVECIPVELGNLSSIAQACEKLKEKEIDYLLLNAGITEQGNDANGVQRTEDGIEKVVGVNHVAGCMLAMKLMPIMEATAKSSPIIGIAPMITFVSSDLHNLHSSTGAPKLIGPPVQDDLVRYLSNQGAAGLDATLTFDLPKDDPNHLTYDGVWSYKYSKLLNVLAATALNQKLIDSKSPIRSNSMEPGFVPASDLSRGVKEKIGTWGSRFLMAIIYYSPLNWFLQHMLGQPVRTLEEAGKSEVYALTKGKAGIYYRLDEEDPPSPLASEQAVVDQFWANTMALLKEKGFDVE